MRLDGFIQPFWCRDLEILHIVGLAPRYGNFGSDNVDQF